MSKRNQKIPHVFVAQKAFNRATREAEKFYQLGKKQSKSPWEAAMYPLAALKLRGGLCKSPLEYIELSETEVVIVTHVLYPSDEYKDYSSGHAGFEEGANDYLNPIIDRCIQRYPLIDAFCKMHSHTSKGGSYLSTGDLNCSVFNSYNWFREKGLNTMFSFVLNPSKDSWQVTCFGLNEQGKNVVVPVETIPDSDILVKEAKSLPYYMTRDGAVWCDHNKEELKAQGYRVARNILRRGWRRYSIFAQKTYVICLPPLFPRQIVKVFQVVNDPENPFQEIRLPQGIRWSIPSNKFKGYSLVDLVELIIK